MHNSTVETWLGHIASYEKEFKKWESRADKIIKRYRDENRKSSDGAKFNILWSNVQTLVPATYSRLPQPDVSRRFKDNDPVGRVASLIIERALDFEIQHYPDYRTTMRQSVYDRFLGGRGTAWARYEPHIRALPGQPAEGEEVTEDVEAPAEELQYECAPTDYVHWKDFGHTNARTWEEVTGVWRRVFMTRDAMVERFGEELGKKVPLDVTPEDLKKGDAVNLDYSRGLIYEIWDKETETAIWISKSLGEVLDEKPDPLELEGFFPCPKPLYATITNESLVPVPDFTLYQDQANTLDILCERIDGLVRALKISGGYDASVPELARIFTEGSNNTLIPVKNWAPFSEKQGLAGTISIVDLGPIAAALRESYGAMEQIKAQVYEITGISDIVRGQTNPHETLGAQELKGQYASLRLRAMQEEVSLYATQLLQLKAQIICTKFDPQTIMKIAAVEQLSPEDQAMVPQAMQLIADRPLRSFRVEIAADTLVQIDENTEKENRVEFLRAVGGFLEQGAAVGAQSPQMVPVIMALLKFGITGFKVGKQVEGTLDAALDNLQKAAMNPQPPPPDPKLEVQKLKAESDKQRITAEQQMLPMKVQAEKTKAEAGIIEANLDLQKAQVEATMPPKPPSE